MNLHKHKHEYTTYENNKINKISRNGKGFKYFKKILRSGKFLFGPPSCSNVLVRMSGKFQILNAKTDAVWHDQHIMKKVTEYHQLAKNCHKPWARLTEIMAKFLTWKYDTAMWLPHFRWFAPCQGLMPYVCDHEGFHCTWGAPPLTFWAS